MPSAEAQANALITLLENLQPRWALTPHLSRLEKIVVELKGGEEEVVLVSTVKAAKSPVNNNLQKKTVPKAVQQVWNDPSVLSKILDFDGSLGYYWRNYDLLVGVGRPTPLNQQTTTKYLTHRAGTRGMPLVNKACHRLTLGKEGLQHLQVSYQTKLEQQIAIAKETKKDVTVSWLARVYAMAMADDAFGLDSMIRMYADPKQAAGPFGAALDLYYDDEYFELRLPPHHPFEGCAVTNLVEFRSDYDEGDHRQGALIAELAYNAMRVGAIKTVDVLKRHYGWGLYYLEFDDKRGGDFLSTFCQYACTQPFHTPHASCIRTLLRGEAIGPESHERLAGSVGNLLHLAAAKGDYELVAALLDCGFDPSIKCEQGNCFLNRNDERLVGRKEFPLPEHWARVRGHAKVAQLLQHTREKLRPDLRQRFQNRPYYSGKLTRFFSEPNRCYGFITPDPLQAGLKGCNGGVFVHISNLQRGARNDGHSNVGYPTPGQKLCFNVRKDRRGRQRADVVISGDDWSYVNLLQMSVPEAEDWWAKYHRDGTDDENSDDEDETDNDSHAPENDESNRYEVPTSINIPLAIGGGYFT